MNQLSARRVLAEATGRRARVILMTMAYQLPPAPSSAFQPEQRTNLLSGDRYGVICSFGAGLLRLDSVACAAP